MRRRTIQRAAVDRAADEWREKQIELVGRCEFCGAYRCHLVVHEIARGSGLRVKAYDKPYATLVLCEDIRPDGLPACHGFMDGKPLAMQLAILKRSRPDDFRLDFFYALTERQYPAAVEIELWTHRLSFVPNL